MLNYAALLYNKFVYRLVNEPHVDQAKTMVFSVSKERALIEVTKNI